MDLNALRIFAEVARLKSFTGAAQSLQLASTSVSNKVQKLERELRTRLLNRTTRSVTLTEAGHQVYAKAQQLLQNADEIEHLAASQAQEPQGLLRVTAPASLVQRPLGDWLIEFRLAHPKVEIELISSNRPLDFQEYQLDFAFRQGRLPDSNLIAKKLMDVHFGLFASPDLVERHRPLEDPKDIEAWPCVNLNIEGVTLPWQFQKADQLIQLEPKGVVRFDALELVQRAAVAGIGIAQLPVLQIEEDLKAGRLLPLLREWWPPPIGSHLVYSEREHMTAKNRCFLEFILRKCKELEPLLREQASI